MVAYLGWCSEDDRSYPKMVHRPSACLLVLSRGCSSLCHLLMSNDHTGYIKSTNHYSPSPSAPPDVLLACSRDSARQLVDSVESSKFQLASSAAIPSFSFASNSSSAFLSCVSSLSSLSAARRRAFPTLVLRRCAEPRFFFFFLSSRRRSLQFFGASPVGACSEMSFGKEERVVKRSIVLSESRPAVVGDGPCLQKQCRRRGFADSQLGSPISLLPLMMDPDRLSLCCRFPPSVPSRGEKVAGRQTA